MIQPLTGQQYSEKVAENCVAYWKSIGIYTDAEAEAVEKLLDTFKEETFPPGSSILFTQSPSGSLTVNPFPPKSELSRITKSRPSAFIIFARSRIRSPVLIRPSRLSDVISDRVLQGQHPPGIWESRDQEPGNVAGILDDDRRPARRVPCSQEELGVEDLGAPEEC